MADRFSGWGSLAPHRSGKHVHLFLEDLSRCNRVNAHDQAVKRKADLPKDQQARCQVCTRVYETGL